MPATQTDRLRGLTTSVAVKAPVLVASTGNLTLSSTQVIDGISVSTGDRVLVKDQTVATENGIYIVDSAAWSRAADCDGTRDLRHGTIVFVTTGSTTAADRFYAFSSTSSTSEDITPGTDTITLSITSGDANDAAAQVDLAAAEASSAAKFSSSAAEFSSSAAASATTAQNATVRTWLIDVFRDTVAVSTGAALRTIYAPYAMTLLAGSSGVKGFCVTVSSTAVTTVDININSTTALSTKLTIDATENHSDDAATPPVVSITAIAANDKIEVDVDAAGAGAKGLTVILRGTV